MSSIVIRTAFTNDWEVDHLQYIQAIPERSSGC
jgi:hypothetical protein